MLAVVGLLVYGLIWVYTVHREVRDFTGWQYHTSPGKALGFCFIPFFSLYCIVAMPYRLATWIEATMESGE